jgi:hypothetical protein
VHKDLKFGPTEEAVDETWFATHPFHGVAPFVPQMWDIAAADMASFDPFARLPDALARIELRSIARQRFEREAGRCAVREKLPDGVAAVNRGPIPEEPHPARDLAQQVLKKRDHVVRIDRAVLAVAGERTLGREGADGGEMLASVPVPQDRRLPHWRIGTHDTGQGLESRLIEEEDRLLLGLGPLLMAGQVSSRQRAMAASSRCRARRIGLWGLQRSALRRRPTWVGWYLTPNVTRITAATRARVQTWPRNPEASGPRCHSSGKRASGSVASRRGAPGEGCGCKAVGPPCRARFIHWLTAAALTPMASAI